MNIIPKLSTLPRLRAEGILIVAETKVHSTLIGCAERENPDPPIEESPVALANARFLAQSTEFAALVSEAVPGGIGQAAWPEWQRRAQAALDAAGVPWRFADRQAAEKQQREHSAS